MMNFRYSTALGSLGLASVLLTATGCAMDAASSAPGGEEVGTTHQALANGTFGKLEIGGRCLDLRSGMLSTGIVQIFDCKSGDNQAWALYQGGAIQIDEGPPIYALTYQSAESYFTASSWNQLPSQRFRMPVVQIGSKLGYCLGNSGANNTADLDSCSAASTNNWTFDETTSTIRDPSGRCLTGGTQNQTTAYFSTCGGGNQVWEMGGNGSLRQNNLCLDVRGGTNKIGQAVQVFNCTGSSNQGWTFTGQLTLVSNPGSCVYVPTTANETQIALGNCFEGYNVWKFAW